MVGSGTDLDEIHSHFASAMEWIVRVAFLVSFLLFTSYVTGLVPAGRPVSEVPERWHLSSKEFRSGADNLSGWAWLGEVGDGEYLSLLGLVLFPAGAIIALCILAIQFGKRRAAVWAAMAAVQAIVLTFAATA